MFSLPGPPGALPAWTILGMMGALLFAPPAPSATPAPSGVDSSDWEAVEPGGRTSCAHGDPFRFFVRPGDSHRVLLYLTGGGGCSDPEGCVEGSNRYTQRVPADPSAGFAGILDPGHPENPFRDHTMVVVPVCTGDVHLGDRDERYVLEGEGEVRREFTVHHRGLVNGLAALEWLAEHRPDPTEVFVAGGSAGAVATPVYASLLARRHPQARVVGLSDDAGSYIAGAMPRTDTRRWGMADALAAHVGWEGFPEELATDRILVAAAGDLPNLRLHQVDHAHDRVQVFFHGEGGEADPDLPALLRQARERIRSQVPSYRAFVLGGYVHQSLHRPYFYGLAQGGHRLRDWVAAMAAGDEVPDVECSGCQVPGFILQDEDLRVLEGALELLEGEDAWEPNSSRGCPSDEGRFTLACALLTELAREFPDPVAAARVSGAVAATHYAAAARVPYDRDDWSPIRRFNDEVATSVHDVRALLRDVRGEAGSAPVRPAPGAGEARLPRAGFEDFRESAGRVEGGVLRVVLEATAAEWRPWGAEGPALYTHVFAAEGDAPRVPAPLIRVHAGTPVHVTVRNRLPDTLAVRGLRDTAQGDPDLATVIEEQVVVAPGGETEFRFRPSVPGTYSYGGARLSAGPLGDVALPGGTEADRGLRGLLIVDPPEEAPDPDERFFLLTHWGDEELSASFLPATRFFINGRSWPHTERLTYAQGDTVRWRVINFTGRPHPMHLHGFYFHVDARGDLFREQVFPPEERRAAVTETLAPTETMRMSWVATEPGNWVFHCHFMRHMSWVQTAPIDGPPPTHAHEGSHGPLQGEELMGGLVLGVTVLPGPDHRPAADRARRRLELFINEREGVFGDEPAYAFVLGDGASRPAADSVHFPGSPLTLTRGEPTEIVVHNRAQVPLGVHWHGLELESWADGVPGWSGLPGRVVPAIAPGDSLAVRMTPPRAGTFMYHVHSEPGHQLAQGLYGPFLVLEEGEAWDRERDRFFLLGSLGVGDDPPPAVNGRLEPQAEAFRAGTTYRLRFMHISPDDDKEVALLRDGEPVVWRHVAKDGADLPPSQVRDQPAELRIHVGETYDFLWEPTEPGEYTLRVVTDFDRGVAVFPRDAPPPDTLHIPVTVEGGGAGARASRPVRPERGLVPEDVGSESGSVYKATIRRTAYGVAHIEAEDLGGLGFGEGYAQAEDHLCTMSAQILMARGEQAKYLGSGVGNSNLMTDVVLRGVGFPERGWEFLARQPPEAREWLEGFTAGYNHYLRGSAPEDHPEWCRGAEWVAPIEPRDLAAYVHLATLHTPLLARQILQARPPERWEPESADSEGGESLGDPFGFFAGGMGASSGWLAGPSGGTGASNGWAVGRDLSASGRGMLVANPHVAWTGSIRMWEKHLSIPGELDVYGVNRIGLPGVLIGFNEHVAWTHTVSPAAFRTLRALELIPGEPTRFRYGDEVREITALEVEVEVRGLPEPVRRTVWLSDRGPIVGGAPFDWTAERAYAIRDVNDDDRAAPLLHLLGTARARSLDELRQVHREHQPFTRLHTLATDASGEVWYVDSSAVPHLSPEALEVWLAGSEADPLIGRMAESGTIVLDGSDPLFDEVDDPEAARPGIAPFRSLPQLRRTDYVFNANDSHWLVHGEIRLEGGYSPFLNGGARPLVPRGRNNALHLEDRVPGRTFRTDGRFTFEGLQAAILSERSLVADLLVPELAQRCRANPRVVMADEGAVDLGPACSVLERWDRDFGPASRGAVLFREWMGQYEWEDLLRAGRLFAEDFDSTDPMNTPRGLASGPLALENLARALRILESQGLPLDVELGAVQYAGSKLPARIPIPGASEREAGLSNTRFDLRPPTHEPVELPPGVPGSRYLTESGYPVLSSHGLLMVVEFTDDGPRAEAILAGGQSGNPDSKHFRDQTELYSRGEWRPVLFRPEEVGAGAVREYTVAGEGGAAGAGPGSAAPGSATAVPEPVGRPPGPEEPTSTGRCP
jgi:acyl-homoserine-lactone acylase